jgi:GH15 family glucan-1,4-alpha-glucosidase
MLRCRTRLGLLSEDIDVHTGELWGNYPQSYSLVGIILSAIQLSRPWEDAF